MINLGIHTRHDTTIALQIENNYHVVELERIYSQRYFSLRHSNRTPIDLINEVCKIYGTLDFDQGSLVGFNLGNCRKDWSGFNVKQWNVAQHHQSHAACAFYQSPFEKAIVISFDGGGSDGFFRCFLCDRKTGIQYYDRSIPINLGSAYAASAVPIKEIKKNPKNMLPNAGKLMGLVAYGKPRNEWFEAVRDFYCVTTEPSNVRAERLPELGQKIGLDFSRPDTISGETACDFAATCQFVFEHIFLSVALPWIKEHNLPVCLSGGCALNVSLNEKLARKIDKQIYIPPNPNDCGLAIGAIWLHSPPRGIPNVTYNGVPLLDKDKLELATKKAGPADVAKILAQGKIIGVARGNSEHGPRALGNRSLLCDPGVEGMKDRLNNKVKFRESFRPYAPVVRKEDASKFFNCLDYDMSYMSFNPSVKEEWKNKLPAIVHVDGTARVQTVTRQQNQWLYDVLTEFEKIRGYGVLLNTSFNTKGKPILTTVEEALSNLNTTDIDFVLLEDFIFERQNSDLLV